MKYKGNTVSIVVTIPEKQYYTKFKNIIDYRIDDYECKVVRNVVDKGVRRLTKKELIDVEILRSIADELGVLDKTRESAKVVLRTALVYYLKKKYSGPLLARVFNWNNSNIVFCIRRYEELKHYADYEQASIQVIQHLRQCSLADYFREKL